MSKVVKGAILNLGGLGLPMIVAVFTIPYLIHLLGAEKFGLLALMWAVVSYAGIFDLGLGRALTMQIAMFDRQACLSTLGAIIGTAYVLMAAVSIVLGVLIFLISGEIVSLVKGVTDPQETVTAFQVMSVSIPFIILASGFRGVLEARQAFGRVNAVRLPLGVYTFVGPVLVGMIFGARLDLIAVVLVLGRVLACAVYWHSARRHVAPIEHGQLAWDRRHVKSLCASGGWLSVASVVGPIMTYADRFVLGGLVSANAVAFYVTPNELVTKLWILPGALTAVLFPLFSGGFSSSDRKATRHLFDLSSAAIFGIIAPLSLALAVLSYDLLALWVGAEFAREGQMLLVIFAFAILVNCMAHVPLTLLQGTGSARAVALLQVIEIPIFLGVLWGLTLNFGVLGAAYAWVVRAVFDTAFMMYLACTKLDAPFMGRLTMVFAGVIVLLGVYSVVKDWGIAERLLVIGFVGVLSAVALVLMMTRSIKLKPKTEA
ncbi:flippase [Pseudomonas sp. RC3H12]|uniref:flippase n=1 Tax=Pseudomonas sp. RC3H12 TaxID=2834406 RepID=UPI001BDE55F3|nr:flippase [Pseudomonas sp. RC3H12]QWA29930.1 flippase [Pseudomonas sp. RC3H12]